MVTKFKNDVIAITGAAQGIGRDLALTLAKWGCKGLALADFNGEELAKTAKDIGDKCTVSTHVLDVRNLEDLERYRDEAVEKHGRVSVLINNAGVISLGPFEEQSKEQFDRVIDINFVAVVDCSRVFLPVLKKEKEAHLVNISSMYGYYVSADDSSYHASKFAVRGWTEAMAVEFSQNCPQVKVHCVHPGYVRTTLMNNASLLSKMTRDEALEWFKEIGLTNSDQASRTILSAVASNQFRIRVGPDSYMLDYLPRLLPGTYLTNPTFHKASYAYCTTSAYAAALLRDKLGLGEAASVAVVVSTQLLILRKLVGTLTGRL